MGNPTDRQIMWTVLTHSPSQGADAADEVVKQIKEAGGDAFAFQADVANREGVHGLIDAAVQRWGRVDILVNNSALIHDATYLEKEQEEQIDRLFAVNYKGTLWGIQAAAKVLQPGGSIINISSIAPRLVFPVRLQISATIVNIFFFLLFNIGLWSVRWLKGSRGYLD